MSYNVRLLTPSTRVVPFTDLMLDVEYIKLAAGMDKDWERLEVFNTEGNTISILARSVVSHESQAEKTLADLKWSLENSLPVSAREWLKRYFTRIKAIYTFQLMPDNITQDSWPILGRLQNLLKDTLTGIIQADKEGYYNENGDYVLWQMYENATGSIPAAVLNENGEWVKFELRLNDEKAIEDFKQGQVPPRGFLGRLFGR